MRLKTYLYALRTYYLNDPNRFFLEWQKVPTKFGSEDSPTLAAITEFVNKFLTANGASMYCTEYATSALEGYHSSHHRLVPKSKFYTKYYGHRHALHALIWNSNRVMKVKDSILRKK